MNSFSSVQLPCHVQLFATPWTSARQAYLSITNSRNLLKLMSIELVTPSNHPSSVIPFSSCLQSFPASGSNESVLCIRWSKCWSFGFSSGPSNVYQDWFPLRWTSFISSQSKGLSSLLQHHSSKASILRRSAFFIVQLLHPYMTTGNTIALTRWTFVGKVMSLLFNMLSQWVITFLPRSKWTLVSWLQSPFAVILELPKIKSVIVSIVSLSICHEVMGPYAMILVFWMLSFKPTFSLSSFTFIKRHFSSLLSAIMVGHLHIWGYWYFSWQSWFQLVLHPAQDCPWCTLHRSSISRWQYTALTYSYSYLEPACCSMSSSNCCFLTYTQISQEAGQVVWYSHLFKNFPDWTH